MEAKKYYQEVITENNPRKPCMCLDCNICLEPVQDPVVTLCGHLYCWPCIYKWLHIHSISINTETPTLQRKCPVCKSEVSRDTLVPLYGRGETAKLSKSKPSSLVIPQRPSGLGFNVRTLLSTSGINRNRIRTLEREYLYEPEPYDSRSHLGIIGEVMYGRMFGNSASGDMYSYSNSHQFGGSDASRVRRRLAQADKSLGRICFFLCCCLIACLILF